MTSSAQVLIRRVVTLCVISIAFLPGCEGCQGCAEELNHAAAFGWRKFADTDVDFSEFDAGNYTIAARFMIQYPNAYTAPLLAASGGGFELSKQSGAPRLQLRVGSITASYSAAPLTAKEWHHVAVVMGNGVYSLYLDGSLVCPDGFAACALNQVGTQGSGVLRMGRPGASPISGASESQYYGFLDDVAVFDAALSPADVGALATAHRLTGNESALHAGWTFDDRTPSGGALPAELSRPVTWRRGTAASSTVSSIPFAAIVSLERVDSNDANFLPFPDQQAVLTLPFPKGEAWVVGQGWENTSISHSGRASFAWDFNLAGQPLSATNGMPFYAAAGGTVVELNDGAACGAGWPANYVMIEQATDEIGAYLHAVAGSIDVALNQNVATGTELAETGDTGNTGCGNYHLHFALHNLPESQPGILVTIPAAFSNYEVSTDGGTIWSLVVKGVPAQGDWVRNPN